MASDQHLFELHKKEFEKKDDYGLIKLGIIFVLIVAVIVGAFFSHFKNLDVQEQQKKIEANKLAWQKYNTELYNQQQWALYQQQMNKYNQSIASIQPTPIGTPIKIN